MATQLSSADALFLSRVGSRHLGTAFAISSALSMALLWFIGGLADRKERAQLLWRTSLVGLALVATVVACNTALPRWSATLLLVGGKQVGGVLELLLWVVVADRFTAREARKIVPWIVVANGGGAAVGALLVGPVANAAGSMGPLWISAALLLLVSFSARLLLLAPDQRIAQKGRKTNRGNSEKTLSLLKERPMAKWLAIVVACAGIFAPMMYYLLGVSAAAEYTSEVKLAGFFGQYRAYVQAAALLAQVAIAPWVSKRLGVGMMLLLAPLGAVVAAAVVGMQPVFLVVLGAQAATRVWDTALQTPAEQLIQNLLPHDVRGRVAGLVGGLAKRSGAVVGGLLASLLIVQPSLFAIALFLSACLWLASALYLWKHFSAFAVAELRVGSRATRSSSDVAMRFATAKGMELLRQQLCKEESREQDNAIALICQLVSLGKVDAIAEFLSALGRQDATCPKLRHAVQMQLGEGAMVTPNACQHAFSLLGMKQNSAQELSVQVLGCAPLNPLQMVRVLKHCEGLSSLHSDVALSRIKKESVLQGLVGAGHSLALQYELRIEIARALRGLSEDCSEDIAERLLRCIARNPQPEMQCAAVQSIALSLPEQSAVTVLMRRRMLELAPRWFLHADSAIREASVLAMQASGESDCKWLVQALADRDEAVRHRAEHALREEGERALSALSMASQSGRRRVRLAAVDILADLRPSQDSLDSLLGRELTEMVVCSESQASLRELPNGDLVRRRLSERVDEAVEAALMALEATTNNPGIGEVAKRLARASGARSRARALEALDTLLPRKIAHPMLRALEGDTEQSHDLHDCIDLQLQSRDRLTRDLLVYALDADGRASFRQSIAAAAEKAVEAADPMALVQRLIRGGATLDVEVPSVLETIVALSELSLFADLSTVQLEDLAATVEWQRFAEKDTAMQQGEDAHCMYFVRSGRFSVWVDDEKVAEIASGEPMGELGLFVEDTRSATVIAMEASLVGRITREDVENLIEEIPGVGLRLCRAMSRRLADANRKERTSSAG